MSSSSASQQRAASPVCRCSAIPRLARIRNVVKKKATMRVATSPAKLALAGCDSDPDLSRGGLRTVEQGCGDALSFSVDCRGPGSMTCQATALDRAPCRKIIAPERVRYQPRDRANTRSGTNAIYSLWCGVALILPRFDGMSRSAGRRTRSGASLQRSVAGGPGV